MTVNQCPGDGHTIADNHIIDSQYISDHTFVPLPVRCAAAAAFSNTLFSAMATWPVSADICVSLRTNTGVLSMSEFLDAECNVRTTCKKSMLASQSSFSCEGS